MARSSDNGATSGAPPEEPTAKRTTEAPVRGVHRRDIPPDPMAPDAIPASPDQSSLDTPAARRSRRRATDREPPRRNEPGATSPANSIGATRELQRMRAGFDGPSEPPPSSSASASQNPASSPTERAAFDGDFIPDHVRKRFVQVGRQHYFPDGADAFTDRGARLTTRSENQAVIQSLVEIMHHRSGGDITVSGTERFRREAWFEGKLLGATVRGYSATSYDQERLVRELARRSPQASTPESSPAANANTRPIVSSQRSRAAQLEHATRRRRENDGLLVGRLVDHGPGEHPKYGNASYFVKIETDRGPEFAWGVDLHRALKESLTRPQSGEEIGLRKIKREAIELPTAEINENGEPTGRTVKVQAHRNRWIVEKKEFFRERIQQARTFTRADAQEGTRRHPQLAGAYLKLKAAELAAQRAEIEPADRRLILTAVRERLAADIARGDPLAPVRLNESTRQRGAPATSPTPRKPEDPVINV